MPRQSLDLNLQAFKDENIYCQGELAQGLEGFV